MKFVYIHVIWFSLWIALGVEDYPFGLLTMIVSLEAIFLSTFVMISQNRADEKRQERQRPDEVLHAEAAAEVLLEFVKAQPKAVK